MRPRNVTQKRSGQGEPQWCFLEELAFEQNPEGGIEIQQQYRRLTWSLVLLS